MFKHVVSKILNVALLTFFFGGPIPLCAQTPSQKTAAATDFDQWIDHLPYNNIQHVATLDGLTYAATPTGLLVYNDDAKEYQRYSTINGLSDINITAIAAHQPTGTLWIGYASGRIDLLTPRGTQSIAAIEETPSYSGLKRINDIAFYNDKAYIATNFGIVEFHTQTRLAGRTLLLGPNYTATEILSLDISPAGALLAYSPDHPSQDLLYGDLNPNNPTFTAPTPAWTITGSIDHIRWHEAEQTFIAAYNDLPTGQSLLYRITPDPANPTTEASKASYPGMGNTHPTMMYHNILDLHTTGKTLTVTRNFNVLTRTATAPLTYTDSANISGVLFAEGVFNPTSATHDPATGTTYIGNRRTGLIRSRNLTDNSRILPNAPYSSRAYKIIPYGLGRNNSPVPQTSAYNTYSGNYGGLLIASGSLTDLWTKTFNSDGVFRYEGQNWSHLSSASLFNLSDFVDGAQRITPEGDTLTYFSAWGGGLVALSGDSAKLYNTTNTGGVLQGVNGNDNDLRTGGIAFDDDHNLWGVQSLVSQPLYRCTPDGTFSAHSLSPGADGVALKDVIYLGGDLFIQSRTNGIYCFDTQTEATRTLRSGVGLGNLPSNHVLSMAADLDGELWIGTDEGLVVLYSPRNVFSSGSIDARPILFEEDGVVQKLLGETPITSIFVDGGNRKWIGTRGAGLFLFSADGLQTLGQFTTANSPLLSNTITSIAADPASGEVLIATEQGLIGYRGDGTPAFTGTNPELTTYPNPVRPGYEGAIFIQGLPEDGRVKITDINSALVYEARANGGMVRWDGVFMDGTKVPSGVYLIYAMDELGTITAQDKVLIVR
jgi:hypothetical protein